MAHDLSDINDLIGSECLNVTNTAFLGHVGEIELGAAIGGVFYIAIFIIGFGFSQGSQILIGRRNGEKNIWKIRVCITENQLN